VDFDEVGRVEKIREYGLKDAKDIRIASRTTPTQGEKLGFFEQLFGNGLLGVNRE
jgi:outer membrane protein assembly factor BamE (lipoprotein component of BamABCDE complex)